MNQMITMNQMKSVVEAFYDRRLAYCYRYPTVGLNAKHYKERSKEDVVANILAVIECNSIRSTMEISYASIYVSQKCEVDKALIDKFALDAALHFMAEFDFLRVQNMKFDGLLKDFNYTGYNPLNEKSRSINAALENYLVELVQASLGEIALVKHERAIYTIELGLWCLDGLSKNRENRAGKHLNDVDDPEDYFDDAIRVLFGTYHFDEAVVKYIDNSLELKQTNFYKIVNEIFDPRTLQAIVTATKWQVMRQTRDIKGMQIIQVVLKKTLQKINWMELPLLHAEFIDALADLVLDLFKIMFNEVTMHSYKTTGGHQYQFTVFTDVKPPQEIFAGENDLELPYFCEIEKNISPNKEDVGKTIVEQETSHKQL